jgi:hypothetical protein
MVGLALLAGLLDLSENEGRRLFEINVALGGGLVLLALGGFLVVEATSALGGSASPALRLKWPWYPLAGLPILIGIGQLMVNNPGRLPWLFPVVNIGIVALPSAAALAHPLTILTAFVAAPLTSLTPVIGAGYVTAFVQAYLCPPSVRELHSVADDIRITQQWWRNRVLRIFLAFILPGIGSMIGTWIGGVEIFSNLFS